MLMLMRVVWTDHWGLLYFGGTTRRMIYCPGQVCNYLIQHPNTALRFQQIRT